MCLIPTTPPPQFLSLLYNIPTFAAPADFDGSSSCALYLASLAFRRPRWYSVAAGMWKQKWRWWALIRNASLVPALFCYLCSFGSLQFPSLFHWSSLVSPSLQASLIKHVLKFQFLQDSGDDPYQSGHHAMFFVLFAHSRNLCARIYMAVMTCMYCYAIRNAWTSASWSKSSV